MRCSACERHMVAHDGAALCSLHSVIHGRRALTTLPSSKPHFLSKIMAHQPDQPELCSKISDKVKMAGFLEKKGSMLWKRYWFVLEDKLLLYYKSQLEYMNLSPCRGSVNMNLASAVQPRRNTADPIIHLLSRSKNLTLRAQDRETQQQWLQALLYSMGKPSASTSTFAMRLSMDDLPTQPKHTRDYGGSLDAIWKPTPIISFNEEIDENQNNDPFISKDKKCQTLDGRKIDFKLEKLKSAIGRRKPNAAQPSKPTIRQPSFIKKILNKNPSNSNTNTRISTDDLNAVLAESDDDPLYDTINHPVAQPKPAFATLTLLPDQAMAELKVKLKSRETQDPPALPPRSPIYQVINKQQKKKKEQSNFESHLQNNDLARNNLSDLNIQKNETFNEQRPKSNESDFEPDLVQENETSNKQQLNSNDKDPSSDLCSLECKISNQQKLNPNDEDPSLDLCCQENQMSSQKFEEIYVAKDDNQEPVASSEGSTLQQVEQGLCDLDALLLRLTDMTAAPLLERGGLNSWSPAPSIVPRSPAKLKRCHSDPDYDVPRPHAPLPSVDMDQMDRISATQFFNQVEASSTGSSENLEPDSLESKK